RAGGQGILGRDPRRQAHDAPVRHPVADRRVRASRPEAAQALRRAVHGALRQPAVEATAHARARVQQFLVPRVALVRGRRVRQHPGAPTPGVSTALPMNDLSATPICVNLDGTLVNSDLLIESFLTFARNEPLQLWRVLPWLAGGKARLKAELARRAAPDVTLLPYNERLLTWLKEQKSAGRALWLCTASNYRLAQAVADHLGIFDGVVASTDDHNLSGRAKAAELERRF